MIELGKQALENIAKIKILSDDKDTIRKATENEEYRLHYEVYQPKIREIERTRDIAIDELLSKRDTIVAEKDMEIEGLHTVVAQVKRILEYLRLDTSRDLTILADDIKMRERYGEHPYKEDLDYFLNDTYLKVKLLIVQNEKPVNKYSLVAIGKCLFPEYLLELPRSYGQPYYTDGRYEIETTIRDFPTVEQAKDWLNNHKGKLNLVAGYETVKKEYQDTIQNYKVRDFEDLVMVECPCGRYYYTEFERDYYSLTIRNNELRCPRCNTQLAAKPLSE